MSNNIFKNLDKYDDEEIIENFENQIPEFLEDPESHQVYKDPVWTKYGDIYERQNILDCIRDQKGDSKGRIVTETDLTSDHHLKKMVDHISNPQYNENIGVNNYYLNLLILEYVMQLKKFMFEMSNDMMSKFEKYERQFYRYYRQHQDSSDTIKEDTVFYKDEFKKDKEIPTINTDIYIYHENYKLTESQDDHHIVTISRDNRYLLHALKDVTITDRKTKEKTVIKSNNYISVCAFSKDNKDVAIAYNENVRIYNMESKSYREIHRIGNVLDIKYSPDNKIFAVLSRDRSIAFYRRYDLSLIKTLENIDMRIIDFNYSGHMMASVGDTSMEVVYMYSNTVLMNAKKVRGTGLEFGRKNFLAVSYYNGHLELYNYQDLKVILARHMNVYPILNFAISRDIQCRYIAFNSNGTTIMFYDTRKFAIAKKWDIYGLGMLLFTPYNQSLVACHNQGYMLLTLEGKSFEKKMKPKKVMNRFYNKTEQVEIPSCEEISKDLEDIDFKWESSEDNSDE